MQSDKHEQVFTEGVHVFELIHGFDSYIFVIVKLLINKKWIIFWLNSQIPPTNVNYSEMCTNLRSCFWVVQVFTFPREHCQIHNEVLKMKFKLGYVKRQTH